MTVENTARKTTAATNGSANDFPCNWKIFAAADVEAHWLESGEDEYVELVNGSDFQVILDSPSNLPSTFTLRTLSGGVSTPLAAGTIKIFGDKAQAQDVTVAGAVTPKTLQSFMDRTMVWLQEIQARVDRAILFAITTALANTFKFQEFSSSDDAKYLQIDWANKLIKAVAAVDAGEISVSSFMETVLTAANAAAARTALGVPDGSLFVQKAGDTMTGALDFGGTQKVTGLAAPTNANDAVRKAYADLFLLLSGGTMSGPIAMGTNKITGLGDPTLAQDAATKAYVDGLGFVGCKAKRTSNQSIANSSNVQIQFTAADEFDTDAMHDTAVNNTRVTVATGKDGYYLLIGMVQWDSNATGNRQASLRKNGSSTGGVVFYRAISGSETQQIAVDIVSAVATDYFELNVFQTSGGNLNVNDATLIAVKLR